jgi:hypothetical protein
LPKILGHMALCLSPSFWEVTKQLFLLLLVIMSTIHSICQLETSTTMFAVHTVMPSPLLHFWLYQKVSSITCLIYRANGKFIADKVNSGKPEFRKFRCQLFHSSLSTILQSLKPGMTTPEILRCADHHFRRVIFGLGPYIADYMEQVLLACIVQHWCAR